MKTFILLAFLTLNMNGCPDENCRECRFVEPQPVCRWCQYSYLDPVNQDCVSPNSKVDHCLTYSKDGAHGCLFCDIGYILVGDKCEACPKNCSTCNPDQKTCLTCYNGIRPVNGSCDTDQKCISNDCEICTETLCK